MITNKSRNIPTGSTNVVHNAHRIKGAFKDCSINVSLDIKTTVLL
jgi:hypothetical protein